MLGLDNFYIADSVEFMKNKVADNFFDLTVTSPPYDDLRNYNGFKFDYKTMLNELYRVTKIGGVVVWVVGDKIHKGSESGTSFKQALYAMEIGFNLHDTMIYEKHNPMPNAGTRYQQSFEYMFIFSKGKPKTTNIALRERLNKANDKRTYRKKSFSRDQDGEFTKSDYHIKDYVPKGNVWKYLVGLYHTSSDKVAFKHPAIFPEELAQDHILSWSNENDIVFDPMCGSGTVAKMAYLNNRRYICVDMSVEYISNICVPRLEHIKQQINLF